MCRLLGYLGSPISLGSLVAAPPHSLLRQSWQPKELQGATVNADGWGAGFFVEGEDEPCLYASTLPIWADSNLSHLGRAIRSSCLLAAVRSATDPSSVAQANTQPFARGGLAFLHNGFVERFRETVQRRLCGELSDRRFAQIAGTSDSEHVFALIAEHLDRAGAGGGADALVRAAGSAIRAISEWTLAAQARAYFSVVLADADSLVALRSSTHPEPPTLYVLPEGLPLAPGLVVASERLDDDPRWRAVRPGHAIVATRGAPLREVPIP